MVGRGNRLKKEDRLRLISLIRKNTPATEIADTVGCTPQTVYVYRRRLKLSKPTESQTIPGISKGQISKIVSLVKSASKTLQEACTEEGADYSMVKVILSGELKSKKKAHRKKRSDPRETSPLLAMATPCNNLVKVGRHMAAVQKAVRKNKNDDVVSLLKKSLRIYNADKYDEKYDKNDAFYKLLKFESVVDTHAGDGRSNAAERGSYWKKHIKDPIMVVDNDLVRHYATYRHDPADIFLTEMYAKGLRPDVVDIDGFENTFSFMGIAALMAQKGLILTLPTQNAYRAPSKYKERVWGTTLLDKNKCIERAISILNSTGEVFEHVLTSNLTGGVRLYFIKKNK